MTKKTKEQLHALAYVQLSEEVIKLTENYRATMVNADFELVDFMLDYVQLSAKMMAIFFSTYKVPKKLRKEWYPIMIESIESHTDGPETMRQKLIDEVEKHRKETAS